MKVFSVVAVIVLSAICFSGCFAEKTITVKDKKTGIAVTVSENQLEVVGEIPITDNVSIEVSEGE